MAQLSRATQLFFRQFFFSFSDHNRLHIKGAEAYPGLYNYPNSYIPFKSVFLFSQASPVTPQCGFLTLCQPTGEDDEINVCGFPDKSICFIKGIVQRILRGVNTRLK
jgi:hypothetical protein